VTINKPCGGRNYRLPSNLTVFKFVLMMAFRYLKRLFYGAFFEKRWKVSTARLDPRSLPAIAEGREFPPARQWRTFPMHPDFTFYADPFFSADPPGILVEAMNRRTGLGEIVLLQEESHRPLTTDPRHHSYPFTFQADGKQLMLPEIASWSPPLIYAIEGETMKPVGPLRLDADRRILDPTLIEHGGRVYLFGNDIAIGSNALFIWSAASLEDRFELHPMSPVLVSPRGARMAGGLCRLDGRLVRFGQSFLGDYGDGIFVFQVEELSPEQFEETCIGFLSFDRCKGPHTLNVRGPEILFDWYRDCFSPLAASRRLLAHRRARARRASAV
jgi:hypothetical protein